MRITQLAGAIAASGVGGAPTIQGIAPGFGEQITDSSSHVWSIRLSDRTVMKDGVAQAQTNIHELWLSEGVLWAFDGVNWTVLDGTSGLDFPNMISTPGLRRAVGPQVINFTPTGGGGAVALAPGSSTSGGVFSNGDLTLTAGPTASTWYIGRADTAIVSGDKKYFEVTVTNTTGSANSAIGIAGSAINLNSWFGSDGFGNCMYDGGNFAFGGGTTAGGATFTDGDVVGVVVDTVNSMIGFRVNGGSWLPAGYDPVAGTGGRAIAITGDLFPAFQVYYDGTTHEVMTINFGATSFAHAAPTGFTTLSGRAGVAEGVALFPGDDCQSVIDANPAGSTFCFTKGTYTEQSIVPRDGDVYIGEYDGTTGAVLDGNATTVHAFSGTATYVVLKNLFVTNYATPTQDCMIRIFGAYTYIVNCDTTDCTTGGGIWSADHSLVIGCTIHNNGQIGYKIVFDDVPSAACVGSLWDSNEIYGNNPSNGFWGGGEEGGGKAVDTEHLTMWYNYSHDNFGPGFWTDVNNIYTDYWYNKADNNSTNGLEHEISFNGRFFWNSCSNNGSTGSASAFFSGAGIAIENSGGVNVGNADAGIIEIAFNTIVAGSEGRCIAFREQTRGGTGNPYAPSDNWQCQNTNVHDNTCNATAGLNDSQIGLAEDTGDLGVFTSRNIVWDNNHYTMGANAFWAWGDATTAYSFYNFSQWQGLGNDIHGTSV